MAKPNYAFVKRQKELAKKAKKEAKRLRNQAPEPEEQAQPDATVPSGVVVPTTKIE
jgi:hypothetical protein